MNVELLRKIAQVIQERPQEFNMLDYDVPAECGTAHCIGGWARAITGSQTERPHKLLGLTWVAAHHLFFTDDWPDRFAKRYFNARTDRGRAKAAVDRINLFIATEGRE